MTDAHAKAVEAAAVAARELAIPHTNKIEPWDVASTAERSVWLGHAEAAITAYLAAMRAEGWVLVPMEPTDEQKAAGSHAWENCPAWGCPEDIDPRGVVDDCVDVYRAMVGSINRVTDKQIDAAMLKGAGDER